MKRKDKNVQSRTHAWCGFAAKGKEGRKMPRTERYRALRFIILFCDRRILFGNNFCILRLKSSQASRYYRDTIL